MSALRLTVVGSAGSFPSAQSAASCYLVEFGETRVLLDIGNGALGGLQRHVDPRTLDAVFISHLHADHCADLTALYVLLKHGEMRRAARLPVFGPAQLAQRAAGMYSVGGADLGDVFEFRTVRSGQTVAVAGVEVAVAAVAHAGESFGFRVGAGGRVLAYSGDTSECDSLVSLARDAHLALFEASCLESQTQANSAVLTLHMSAAGAARTARRAGVPRLALTHFVDWSRAEDDSRAAYVAEAARHFGGDIDVAYPGRHWVV